MAPLSYLSLLLPFVQKHKHLSRLALYSVPDWHWSIQIPGIGRLRIRLRRNRSLWLRHPLTHEWFPLAVLRAFVRPTDVVWDVGANIGLYSRILVQCFQARQVFAFEPMSDNLPELRYNITNGGIEDRVTVLPWALSNQDGPAGFQVDDIQSASGALDAVYGGDACRARAALDLPPKVEFVQCRTLDSILREGRVPPPDVIKVDIEGAERMFLEGGEKFFSEHSPRLVIETHGSEVTKACLAFLFSKNFHVAGCVPDSWDPTRYLRLSQDVVERITGPYDVHFIAASKNPEDLPISIERNVDRLLESDAH